ncbi:MAG: hypothetical protein AAB783_00670 [Patescibacteria group bacterium]
MKNKEIDAHAVAYLSFLEYGIRQARRASLSHHSVLNSLGLGALVKVLKISKEKHKLSALL